jgi:hypothetical protein
VKVVRSPAVWVPATLLVHVALNLQAVFPPFYQINPADEAQYIFAGRAVMNGISEQHSFLPFFYLGPLIAGLTAVCYAPFHTNPSWFIIAEWESHVILVCLLWTSSYLIAREFRSIVHPAVVMGLLIISPVIPTLLQNTSDALFAAMSGFAFWLFLRFAASRSLWTLAGASAFVGLSALTRSDGLVLFWVFLALAVGISIKRQSAKLAAGLHAGAVAAGPFCLLVLGYLIAFGIVTGFWGSGTEWRTYFAFEQAEGFTYNPSAQGLIDGPLLARALYGTPDENHYSVVSAIMHNPQAFERRLLALPVVFLFILYLTYGGAFAVLQFALAIFGLIELVRTRRLLLALVLVLWPAYLLAYIPVFARGGYLLTAYFCVDVLAAVGFLATIRAAQAAWVSMYRTRRVLLGQRTTALMGAGSALVLVGAGLLTRGPFPEPRLPVLGLSGEEQASLYMTQHFERSTLVAAFLPAVPWTAKMTWQPLVWDVSAGDGPTTGRFGALTVENAADLDQWIARTGVKAFYLDHSLKQYQPKMYATVESAIGHGLDLVFATQDTDPSKRRDLISQGSPYDGWYRIVAVSASR